MKSGTRTARPLSSVACLLAPPAAVSPRRPGSDRKSTRLNSSHTVISYAVFCLKKKMVGDADRGQRPGRGGRHRQGLSGRRQHGPPPVVWVVLEPPAADRHLGDRPVAIRDERTV